MPVFKALKRDEALPSAERGPVDSWALRRFASIWFWVGISFDLRIAGGLRRAAGKNA